MPPEDNESGEEKEKVATKIRLAEWSGEDARGLMGRLEAMMSESKGLSLNLINEKPDHSTVRDLVFLGAGVLGGIAGTLAVKAWLGSKGTTATATPAEATNVTSIRRVG